VRLTKSISIDLEKYQEAVELAYCEESSVESVIERGISLYQQFKAGNLAVVDRPKVSVLSASRISGVNYEEYAEEFLVK